VWKKGSALVPTWLAFAVVNLLEQHFDRLVDYGFTASLEDDLDVIAGGQGNSVEWLSRFYFGSPDGKVGRAGPAGRPEEDHRQEPRRDRRPGDQHHPDRAGRGRPAGRRAGRPLRPYVQVGDDGAEDQQKASLPRTSRRTSSPSTRPSSWPPRRPATGCSAPTR
jgi:DNA topoisomerase-1